MIKNVSYLNSRGAKINGILTLPDSGSKFPCVALCPHFSGFKELKHLHAMSEEFAKIGIASLRFDYTDCMNTQQSCNDMTLSGYALDLEATLDFLDRQVEIDSTKLGAAGHSIGGSTSLIGASKDSRITSVVLIAPLAKGEWEPLFKDHRKEWKRKGKVKFKSPKKGEIEIGYAFYEDLLDFDGTKSVKDIKIPICIIHGTKDEIIPIKHSEILYKNANQPKKFERIQGADHLFTGPKHEKKIIKLCTNWFGKYLTNKPTNKKDN